MTESEGGYSLQYYSLHIRVEKENTQILKDVIDLLTRVQGKVNRPKGGVRFWGKAALCELPKLLKPVLVVFVVISIGKNINL